MDHKLSYPLFKQSDLKSTMDMAWVIPLGPPRTLAAFYDESAPWDRAELVWLEGSYQWLLFDLFENYRCTK